MNRTSFESVQRKFEDQALKDRAFEDLKAKLEGFDPKTQDARGFYLHSVLIWCTDMTDGEVSLIADRVHEKLGITKDALLRDVRSRRKELAAGSNGSDGDRKLEKEKQGRPVLFPEIQPSKEPVDGASLLDELASYFLKYVVLPNGAADAIAAWTVATWFRDQVRIAPILSISSPTKRSGKTLLLDLLKPVVYWGHLTSGVGITPAVLFRMNEKFHPTLLIDEAEKLSGKDESSKELIGLLNVGYRKGATVQRCSGDNHEIIIFDAFGFRAVATIGDIWDTLTDRSVIIKMIRKAQDAKVARFNGRVAEEEGSILARKIARFAADYADVVAALESTADRPTFLNDRAADSWAVLFAVGLLADEGWPERLLESARNLQEAGEEGDRKEILLRDIQSIFSELGNPKHLKSETLVQALNNLESSPWGDLKEKGITTIKLASMLKPFGIKPGQYRDKDGTKVRGYSFESFKDTFARYLPPSKSVQPVQDNKDNELGSFQVGTEDPPIKTDSVQNNKDISSDYKVCTDVPTQNRGIAEDNQLPLKTLIKNDERLQDETSAFGKNAPGAGCVQGGNPWTEIEEVLDDTGSSENIQGEDSQRPSLDL